METFEMFKYIQVPVTALHVISVVLGMGAALVSDVLFTFFAKDKRLNPTERKTLELLSTVVWYGLIFIAVSGAVLFLSDISKYMASHKFLAKMTILFVLLVNGSVLNRHVWPHLSKRGFFSGARETPIRRVAFASGAISVVSWISVCVLGVLDSSPAHYLVIMGIYLAILCSGICVALSIEEREFEMSKK